MIISSGGLAGFSIESMRQLQEEATDEVYIAITTLIVDDVAEDSTRVINNVTVE